MEKTTVKHVWSIMKPIVFCTTFSQIGYKVYGDSWIGSFLKYTEKYPHITAKIYVDGNDTKDILMKNDKIEILDYDTNITNRSEWVKMFEANSIHTGYIFNASLKFSFKSFVIMHMLNNTNEGYAVWLDSDCTFESDLFDDFIEETVQDKFVACQREPGSNHVESGVVIFNTEHPDKQKFYDQFKNFYMTIEGFNSFGEFFDGFVIYRTLDVAQVSCVDLNENHGITGVQSDPNCTFLNPALSKRFHHNIGITGKRSYDNWSTYVLQDKFLKIIPIPIEEQLEEKNNALMKSINENIAKIMEQRNQ
jgi:hypothetical protein